MPNDIKVVALILAGILILIAVLGGNFKLFGAEIASRVDNKLMRWLAGFLALVFVILAFDIKMPQSNTSSNSKSSIPQPTVSLPSTSPPQSSVSTDFARLERFLRAEKWKNADQETTNLILVASNREKEGWLDSAQKIPCDVLNQIDRLWIDSTDGKFGFSVQKQIYIETCGGKPNGQYDEDAWNCLGDQVGWRVRNRWLSDYNELLKTQASIGFLPTPPDGGLGWDIGKRATSSIMQKLVDCNL